MEKIIPFNKIEYASDSQPLLLTNRLREKIESLNKQGYKVTNIITLTDGKNLSAMILSEKIKEDNKENTTKNSKKKGRYIQGLLLGDEIKIECTTEKQAALITKLIGSYINPTDENTLKFMEDKWGEDYAKIMNRGKISFDEKFPELKKEKP